MSEFKLIDARLSNKNTDINFVEKCAKYGAKDGVFSQKYLNLNSPFYQAYQAYLDIYIKTKDEDLSQIERELIKENYLYTIKDDHYNNVGHLRYLVQKELTGYDESSLIETKAIGFVEMLEIFVMPDHRQKSILRECIKHIRKNYPRHLIKVSVYENNGKNPGYIYQKIGFHKQYSVIMGGKLAHVYYM